jgi:importin subunit alpha-1
VVLHEGIIGLRKLLSADQPPIQRVIDLNLVPKMIDLIKQQTYPYLQMEATWALTNIASGTSTQCQSIVDKGGIPIFIKLLSSPLENNVEQAVWALGNIAGDSHYNRDLILKVGGLAELIRVMETTTNPNIFKQGGWAVANLCRGTPRPSYDSVKNSVTVLARVVKEETITDHEILSDCCWALSYLSDGGKTRIAKVVETGVVPRIVSFLGSDVHKIVIPALRTLGNIATGNENQTEAVLQAGCLNYM